MSLHTLTQQTTITIQVIVQDETNAFLFSLLLITKLFWHLFRWSQAAVQLKNEGVAILADIATALSFTYKVLTIVIKSLAYGFGLSL